VVLATVFAAGLAVRVGHSGGELVYVHGAALAYSGSVPGRSNSEAPLEYSESTAANGTRAGIDFLRAQLTPVRAEP